MKLRPKNPGFLGLSYCELNVKGGPYPLHTCRKQFEGGKGKAYLVGSMFKSSRSDQVNFSVGIALRYLLKYFLPLHYAVP